MSITLTGKLELEQNIRNMIDRLGRYLQIVTGKRYDNIDTVAYALFYTLKHHKDVEDIDLNDVNLINSLIKDFDDRTKQKIRETIKSIVGDDNA